MSGRRERAVTKAVGSLLSGLAMICSIAVHGADFTPGNLLVTQGKDLHEYTTSGSLVQTWAVPHPVTDRYDVTDIVVGPMGRAHVLTIAPFDQDFIATLDPVTETWTHILVDTFLGNISDGDLAILGDYLYTKTRQINWLTGNMEAIVLPGRGVGEISVGLDGLLYALDSGSPRHNVRVVDPVSLEVIREFELRDSLGSRLDARGIAVTADGQVAYVADWDGLIYVFDTQGVLLDSHPSGTTSFNDIDLTPGGKLAAGSRFGEVMITDLTFDGTSVFPTFGDQAYVAFVPDDTERVDEDGDGVLDLFDNCPDVPNPDQADGDEDGLGDACDPFPDDPDNLALCIDLLDACAANPLFVDQDADGEYDNTDACPGTLSDDVDAAGCSHRQFCAGFDATTPRGRASCENADWKNDEPLWLARDCQVVDTACVPLPPGPILPN